MIEDPPFDGRYKEECRNPFSPLPLAAGANPMIYEHNGKEYLVIMAGGHHFMKTPQSDALVAYALPSGSQ